MLAPLGAQRAFAQDPAASFGDVLDVRVVNVEVVVTDGEGNRAVGLAREDFRLSVAGRHVPIEYFTEIREGRAMAPSDGAAEASPLGDAVPTGDPVPTSYLVFLDEMFMVGAARDRVLERLEAQLALLGSVDRVAVVAFDGRRLEVLAGWTAPGPQLAATLRSARARPVHGLRRLAERRSVLSGADRRDEERAAFLAELSVSQRESFGQVMSTRLGGEQRAYAELLASQLGQIANAAAGGMRALADAEGRKVMLLLSGGWYFDPIDAVSRDEADRPSAADRGGVPAGEEIYEALTETANLLGYTLYPIDVPGLQGLDLIEQSAPAPLAATPTGGGAGLLPEHATQTTLLHLASRTGGTALLNDLRLEALARPMEDTRSYYWLGFTPDWKGDDEVSRIEIEVLRPGLQARFRRSVLDLSRSAEVTARLESYLFLGPPRHLQFPVRVRELEKRGRKEMVVSLTLAVPVRSVTFLRGESGWQGSLELRFVAMDEDGRRSETVTVPFTVTSKRPPAEGHFRHDVAITLRNVRQDVLLAVHDVASGTLVANRLWIDPAATAPAASAARH